MHQSGKIATKDAEKLSSMLWNHVRAWCDVHLVIFIPLLLKICTKLPKCPHDRQFCAELIYGFSRVMIEFFLMDRFFSLQRVRRLLWRRYQTIPALSTGPIGSEISTKNDQFHQRCPGWCLAHYVCVEISDGNKNKILLKFAFYSRILHFQLLEKLQNSWLWHRTKVPCRR